MFVAISADFDDALTMGEGEALRKLENAEAGRWVRNGNILDEMPRIAARQFEWQRGWFNKPQFYRSAFIWQFLKH